MNRDVREFYNNYLPRMICNQRHGRVKLHLSQIVLPGMRVLDMGCGTGITSLHMAKLGARVVAVDCADKLIKYARKHNSHKNIIYHCLDVGKLDIPDVFDVIVLADVFEHIEPMNISNVMDVIAEHVSTKGTIYLNIPDGRYQIWMQTHHEDKLQIVDEAYAMEDILEMFRQRMFWPAKIEIYGVDVPYQYNAYVFKHMSHFTRTYNVRM